MNGVSVVEESRALGGDEVVADDDEVAAADASNVEPLEIERRLAVVDASAHGERLDKWLVRIAPEFSRAHLQGLVEGGHVRSGAQVLRQSHKKVSAGQQIEVTLWPTAQSTAFRAEAMTLAVVYEDAHLLVIDKPAGLVVHPAAGHWSGTLLNGLLAHHAAAAHLPRAGIVHRLDKDTSGLMLVAKSLQAHTALVRAIAARDVKREYLALVHGAVVAGLQVIEAPLGRDPISRVRMAIVASGKPARTDVRCLAVADLPGDGVRQVPGSVRAPRQVSAVHCQLHTGRTHQIRVHLASRGHPLLADVMYGGAPAFGLLRQALHAARLHLLHPIDGRPMAFEAALPADLALAWRAVGGDPASALPPYGYNQGQ